MIDLKKFAVSFIFAVTILLSLILTVSAAKAELFSAVLTYDGAEHAYTGTNFKIFVEKKQINTPIPPIVLENGRSVVPVREIFEELGATVTWIDASPQRVKISLGGSSVVLTIGNKTAIVNGDYVTMETSARLIGMGSVGKTMVPVRFVSEMLSMQVDYDDESGIIDIYKPKIVEPEPEIKPEPEPEENPGKTEESDPEDEKNISGDDGKNNDENTEDDKITNRITSLKTKKSGNTLTVTVSTLEKVEGYKESTLSEPNRYVFDIKNCAIGDINKKYKVFTNVSQIRLGDYEGMARIVFDVADIPKVSVKVSEDGKTVVLTVVSDPESDKKQKGPLVWIDAGHGGSDPGAVAYNEGGSIEAKEKDITLAIANQVVDILKSKGVYVKYTRNDDRAVSLEKRTSLANSADADLFVSIHCNAYTDEYASGSLVMYHMTRDYSDCATDGYTLAQNIKKRLVRAIDTKDLGFMKGDTMYVIRKANMPSVIVETAFMTNSSDLDKLTDDDYQTMAAKAIANGICDTIADM